MMHRVSPNTIRLPLIRIGGYPVKWTAWVSSRGFGEWGNEKNEALRIQVSCGFQALIRIKIQKNFVGYAEHPIFALRFWKKSSSLHRNQAKNKDKFSTYLKINLEDMLRSNTFALPNENQADLKRNLEKKFWKILVESIRPLTFALPNQKRV